MSMSLCKLLYHRMGLSYHPGQVQKLAQIGKNHFNTVQKSAEIGMEVPQIFMKQSLIKLRSRNTKIQGNSAITGELTLTTVHTAI